MVRVASRIRRMATGLPVEGIGERQAVGARSCRRITFDMARDLMARHARVLQQRC